MKAHLNKVFIGIVVAVYLASVALTGAVFATPPPIGTAQPTADREPKRGVNPETGRVSFIGGGNPISVPGVSSAKMPPQDRALGFVNVYGREFGLQNPAQELKLLKAQKDGSGNDVVRYQQVFGGVPILAGEMIVSIDNSGALLSISGEISPNLTLSVNPTIPAQAAEQTALIKIAKLHQMNAEQLSSSQPALWIFDESLLKASTRPVELVWRLEVTANDGLKPIREMVLVNAQTGGLSFHVNQVDTGIASKSIERSANPGPAHQAACPSTPLSSSTYFDLAIDEAHGRIFGSDSNNNKLDVFTFSGNNPPAFLTTVCLGFQPKGIDISPDGNELAVALFDGGKIAFYNLSLPNNQLATQTPTYFVPFLGAGDLNKPYDLVYGRAGRLYSVGSPYSLGFDYIHVIDTSTSPKTEISRSTRIIRTYPRLALSADKNTLFALELYMSPAKLYRFDVTTDTVTYQAQDPHGPISGFNIATVDDPSKIFTSDGQVWSTTGYGMGNYFSRMGAFSDRGQEIEYVKAHDLIAVSRETGVSLIETENYNVVARFPTNASAGVAKALSNGSALFVSTAAGLTRISLNPLPTPLPVPCGTDLPKTPYFDMMIDEAHQKIFASDRQGFKVDIFSYANPAKNPILIANICTLGRQPLGLDLSPDGSEVAVSIFDAYKLAFINTSSNAISYVPFLLSTDGYAQPSDVVYGRAGRLYAAASIDDFSPVGTIYAMDLASKTLIARSTGGFFPDAGVSHIALDATKNKLFFTQAGLTPQNIFRMDVSTDSLGDYDAWSPNGPVQVNTLFVMPDNSKLFTSRGQVWSYDLQTMLGNFGAGDEIEHIGLHKAVAVTGNGLLQVDFFSTNTYASLGRYSTIGTAGVSRALSDGSILYVSTSNGLQKIVLTSFPLPTFTPGPGPSRTPGPTSTAGPSPTAVPASSTGNRITYTASNEWAFPGTFLCDQSTVICTGGANPDADKAHRYAADTFVFYNTHHKRNSFNNQGHAIVSTVQFSVGYQNAFWTGFQTVYGDGMAADDIVGHEITHGVTQYSSNLIYSYQSGAINESFSDLWGEFIDQTNGSGNDAASVKWLLGEDTPVGALRSMSDPTLFGHPDKMSSPYYYYGSDDDGGVHVNSGVNNKAAYLMVEGGIFNGRTITGIGLNKTAAVYYEAQFNLLTAGSNYHDLYYALVQACQNLIGGSDGLTQNDCNQVKTAAEAVEMTFIPSPTPTPTPTSSIPDGSLYLSLTSGQTIGGVSSADEDILYFDGINWSLLFDGSDVGVGSTDLSSFAILESNLLLMSFNSAVTVNGISVTPQDILRFDATSLGSTTAGTFSMFFNGSDVGFDDATNEKIDAISFLPDARLLVSTTGSPVVLGVTGAKDEDVLVFTPMYYGNVTAGSWAMYFDGSDVGLGETSGEDVDALDVVNGNIYLSTLDTFSVTGLSGADEDVLVCALVSTGSTTACNYQSALYFDGNTWGLSANDVDGFQYPHQWLTTPVPPVTSTPTRTLTPVVTVSPDNTFLFAPVADARVSEASPTTNYGSATTLLADAGAGAAQTSYLRFDTRELSGSILNAKLRVYCTTNGTANGPAAYLADNGWTEATVNWNTQPALLSGALDNKGAIAAGSWVEYDVTASMSETGIHTFALVGDGSDGVTFSSREGATSPQLLLTLGTSGPISTPTKTPTPTRTPTTQTGNTSTFTSIVDAYVNAGSPASNYGSTSTLRVDASPDVHSYLRFDVQGLSGSVTQATLRLYTNSASSVGCTAHSVTNNTWSEAALTYNNAPPVGSALGSSGAFGAGAWIEIDVTAYITGNGTYNLALITTSSTAVSFNSREAGNGPQLVIETAP